MKACSLPYIAVALLASTSPAEAAEVIFHPVRVRPVTDVEISETDGPSADNFVFDFSLTSNADILRIGDVFIDLAGNPLYNHPLGSNTSPPQPCFVCFGPGIMTADSWITTPGNGTALVGGDLGDDNTHWFDTSDDGPVNHFIFAHLTTNAGGWFRGIVSVAGGNGPESFPFAYQFSIPEPTSLTLLGLGMAGLLGVRRRHHHADHSP